MGDMFYGKVIVIADLLQAGNTCTFTSGATVLTAEVDSNGMVEKILPALKRWEVELDGYTNYVDLGCGECHTVDLALDKTTWQGIQNILDAHRETELLEIGDEVHVDIGGADTIFQVGAIDLYESHEVIFVAKTCIGTRQHHTSNTNSGGWSNSDIRTYLNGNFKNGLPDEIKNNLKSISFKSSAGGQSSAITVTDDYIWLPREYEIFGATTNAATTEAQYCRQYPIFATAAQRIRTNSGVATRWWEASAYVSTSLHFCAVNTDGSVVGDGASSSLGLVPCFRFLAND